MANAAHTATTDRIATWVVVVVSVFYASVALWEIAAPFGAGHVAASTAVAIAAENMLRWHIAAPVTHYTFAAPTTRDWYCNHPFGIFWAQVPFSALLGHRDFVCRLPAVIASAATPPLVFLVGRSLWSAVAGAVAATAFVVLPITLSFSAFNALEVPEMLAVLLAMWGTIRFAQTERRRWLAVALVGTALALNVDWAAWLYVGVVLAGTAPHALRRGGRARLAWLGGCAILLATALFYLGVLTLSGQLPTVIRVAGFRTRGAGRSLVTILAARHYWIELCFTRIALVLGVVALPVVVLRARRRALDALPLATLFMATVQYLVFSNGADVHVFWPHLFALWFALGMGAIAASMQGARPATTLVIGLIVCAAILPDGLRALGYARRTGLRFDEKGGFIEPALDQTAALRWLRSRLPPDVGVALHSSVAHSQSLDWALERPVREERVLSFASDLRFRFLVADRRFLDARDFEEVGRHAVTGIGSLWVIDRGAPPSVAEAYAVVRREPTHAEQIFRSAHDPVMSVAPDPFLTWELRALFHQPVDPLPASPARLDQQLIAYNAAVDGQRALPELDRQSARSLGSAELVGTLLEPGVAPRLHIVLRALGPVTPDARLHVRARVVRAPFLSTVMPSDVSRELGPPFAVPTSLWRAGLLYESVIELRAGVGCERYSAGFSTGDELSLGEVCGR